MTTSYDTFQIPLMLKDAVAIECALAAAARELEHRAEDLALLGLDLSAANRRSEAVEARRLSALMKYSLDVATSLGRVA
jgi:hypothetical protein